MEQVELSLASITSVMSSNLVKVNKDSVEKKKKRVEEIIINLMKMYLDWWVLHIFIHILIIQKIEAIY